MVQRSLSPFPTTSPSPSWAWCVVARRRGDPAELVAEIADLGCRDAARSGALKQAAYWSSVMFQLSGVIMKDGAAERTHYRTIAVNKDTDMNSNYPHIPSVARIPELERGPILAILAAIIAIGAVPIVFDHKQFRELSLAELNEVSGCVREQLLVVADGSERALRHSDLNRAEKMCEAASALAAQREALSIKD